MRTVTRLVSFDITQVSPVETVESVTLFLRPLGKDGISYTGKLPFGLKADDSPEAVRKQFGRAEGDSIDQNGNGYITWIAGAATILPFCVFFNGNELERITLVEDRSSRQQEQSTRNDKRLSEPQGGEGPTRTDGMSSDGRQRML